MTLVKGNMLETRLIADVWEEMLLAVRRIAVIPSELMLFSGKRFVENRVLEFTASLRELLLESDPSA
jgi:hypothetical protein